MIKHPKEKGRRLELRVAQKLRDSGIDKYASRTPLSGGGSIKNDILTKSGLAIECKNVEKINFMSAYNQCLRDRSFGGGLPIVVWSANRVNKDFVFMDFDEFLTIFLYAKSSGYPDKDLKNEEN